MTKHVNGNCYDPKEVWKDVPGYEGYLQASDKGRIRSLYVLKASPATGSGYPLISLPTALGGVNCRRYVHALVALTFIGPRPLKCQVNHKDSSRDNNVPENLEYVTARENFQHAVKAQMARYSLTEDQVYYALNRHFEDGYYPKEIAKEMNVSWRVIGSLIQQERAKGRKKAKIKPGRRLTMTIVRNMRKMYATGKYTQLQIGRKVGLTVGQVSRIVRNEQWPE